MRPTMYLDIDGVLNLHPTAAREALEGHWEEELPLTSVYGPARLPRNLRRNLARLAEEYEIVWASAWRDEAAALGEALGIGRCRVLQWSTMKLPAILAEKKERWAYLDDDATWELEELTDEEADQVGTNLVLNTDPHHGLTDTLTEKLHHWAKHGTHPDTLTREDT